MKKKTSIPLDQVIKKSCDTFKQKWKQAGWAPQLHNQYLQNQALVSPWSHFSIHCILLRRPQRSSKPSAMLLIWRWICFYPARPENTGESAYHQLKTTNLRQHYGHINVSPTWWLSVAVNINFMWLTLSNPTQACEYRQNRHQVLFNWWVLRWCRGAWHSKNWKNSTDLVFYISI